LGLDNVFRGRERPGIVAVSLILRSSLYAISVWFLIPDQSRLMWVPWLLFFSEATGIAVVWFKYSCEFGMPRFRFRHASRFGAAVLAQGRSVLGIQIAQVILASIDVVIIGLSDSWNMVGLYGAPHRIITAAVTFGLIFQQVLLPHLIRSGTIQSNNSSQAIRRITRMALLVLVPATLLISISGKWLIQLLFTEEFQSAWPLLTIGIWRVPLLAVTSIHIATLVASHREKEGLGIMLRCVLIALPTVLFFYYWRGLVGMSASMVFVAMLIACLTGQAIYCLPGRGQAADLFRWQPGGRIRVNQGTVAVGTALILLSGLLWHFGGSYRIASVESRQVVKKSNPIEINELKQTETNPPDPMEKQASKADGLLR
jgi:O-antigen/teichoic acid export membrane protein